MHTYDTAYGYDDGETNPRLLDEWQSVVIVISLAVTTNSFAIKF